MEADSNSINLFTTRVRQMILQYNELKERNTALQATIDSHAAKVDALEKQLAQLRADYDSLKLFVLSHIALE